MPPPRARRAPPPACRRPAGRASAPCGPLALSGALSRALCLVHRLRPPAAAANAAAQLAPGRPPPAGQCRPRLLCLVGSPDVPAQYVPVMNAIFSAQRAEVAVDALVLGPAGPGNSGAGSPFLQQAAHLTGGVYLVAPGPRGAWGPPGGGGGAAQHNGQRQQQPGALPHSGAALQQLLACLSADTATRALLRVHQPLGVDFRASCFCHRRAVDVGYVCSVCLSIFCHELPECAICGTVFPVEEGEQ